MMYWKQDRQLKVIIDSGASFTLKIDRMTLSKNQVWKRDNIYSGSASGNTIREFSDSFDYAGQFYYEAYRSGESNTMVKSSTKMGYKKWVFLVHGYIGCTSDFENSNSGRANYYQEIINTGIYDEVRTVPLYTDETTVKFS